MNLIKICFTFHIKRKNIMLRDFYDFYTFIVNEKFNKGKRQSLQLLYSLLLHSIKCNLDFPLTF